MVINNEPTDDAGIFRTKTFIIPILQRMKVLSDRARLFTELGETCATEDREGKLLAEVTKVWTAFMSGYGTLEDLKILVAEYDNQYGVELLQANV